MTPRVRLKRGIELTLDSGDCVVFDGTSPCDVRVLSHAHSDHLVRSSDAPVVCSPLTADLAAARNGGGELASTNDHPDIDLLSAGHIAGSRAALMTDPDTGDRVLYTGDCRTRSRLGLDGFEPPSADVLVVETIYGRPQYRFPPDNAVLAQIRDWLADTMDSVVLLFGYSLGRAQTLQQLAMQAGRIRIFVPESVAAMNAPIETHRDVTFDVHPLEGSSTLASSNPATPSSSPLAPNVSPSFGLSWTVPSRSPPGSPAGRSTTPTATAPASTPPFRSPTTATSTNSSTSSTPSTPTSSTPTTASPTTLPPTSPARRATTHRH